jgi:hypothetical protein
MIEGVSNDLNDMAICAIRYTMGRSSYIVSSGQNWALEYGAKSKWVRDVIVYDLERLVDQCERGYPSLGDPQVDEPGWRKVLEQLKAMNLTQTKT